MKVLVIDSDRSARGNTLELLRQEKIEAVEAETIKDAIRTIELCPDVQIVILDLETRPGNPLDILVYLNSRSRHRNVSVIVCTSFPDRLLIKRSMELGVRGFLLKPFTEETLLSRIRKAVACAIGAVLVVQDDEVVLEVLARLVKREGYDVLTAHSGEEALKIVASEPVFAVISDVVIPGMSGFDLLVKFKELYPDVFVIMITGQSEKLGPNSLIAAGADGYLTRPFRNVEIAHKLRALRRSYSKLR